LKLAKEYKKPGLGVYGILVFAFVVFAAVFITLKWIERSDPPITVEFKSQNYGIPSLYFCPANLVAFKSAYCDVDENFGEDSDCDFGIVEDDGLYCLVVDYTDSNLTDVPAEILIELLYTGTLDGGLEIEVSFGDDLTRVYYIGTGEQNTQFGLTTNMIISKEQKEYLDSEMNSEQFIATISPTPAVYVEGSTADHDALTCDDSFSSLCTTDVLTTCPLNRTEGSECAFLMVVYLQFQTKTVQIIKEVDPLDIGAIAGVLGGYWVYVGVIFGLCFSVDESKGDDRLYPSKFARRLLCLKS